MSPGGRFRAALAGRGVLPLALVGMFGAFWGLSCGYNLERASPTGLLNPSQPLVSNPVVIISSTGVNPQVLHAGSPATVKFTNQDLVSHKIEDAPELGSGPCPEINGLGTIQPSQSNSVKLNETLSICGYKDAGAPTSMAFQGLIALH
jgi:hypothetical protein